MKTTRRDFVKTSAVASVGFLVSVGNRRKIARASALQGLAMASFGLGGKGAGDVQYMAKNAHIVAICDVDSTVLAGAEETYKDAKPYRDYRELFSDMSDKIDVCSVSTPDHTHTPISAMAIKLGKHCYTQKPLARTIGETRYLARLAKEYGVCTQMGNQGSIFENLRRMVAQVRAGIIGAVKEVYVWTDRPVWVQGPGREMTMEKYIARLKEDNPDDEEIIQDEIAEKERMIRESLAVLDWDLWLGPAPKREFWAGCYHPNEWRGWWDFGTGSLGDMACHTANMACVACGLKNPSSVTAETSGHDFNSFPAKTKIQYEFPSTETRGPVPLYWYDSSVLPDPAILDRYAIKDPPGCGSLIIGEKGAVYSPGSHGRDHIALALGGKIIDDLPGVEYSLAPFNGIPGDTDGQHQLEWFTAIWENKPESCWSAFPGYGGDLTETILLGNLAVWAAPFAGQRGETILWDAEKMRVANSDSLKIKGVDSLIRPVYQNGYAPIEWE